MAFLFGTILSPITILALGLAITIPWDLKANNKRDTSHRHDLERMMFRLDHTNLPKHDLHKLYELNITRSELGDEATFTSRDFEVNGTFVQNKDTALRGMKHGSLSFLVPGFEGPVHGTWVTIDRSSADDKMAREFEREHQILMDALNDGVDDMLDVIQKLTETGSALVDAAVQEG